MEESNVFYNYVYLDPRKPGDYDYGEFRFEYEPFYVGKGYGDRCYVHLKETIDTTYNPKKFNKIEKIRKILGEYPIILKIFENLEECIAFENEKDLIRIIGRDDLKLGPLTNLTGGGEGPVGRLCSDQTREKLKQLFLKNVYQYDLDGNLINQYKSVVEAYDKTGVCHISSCCRGVSKTAGNFIWSYTILSKDEINNKLENLKRKYDISSYSKKIVYQYDLQGNLINIYSSAMEASISTGINNDRITGCCNNNKKTARSFIFSYSILDSNDIKFRVTDDRIKTIIQYDLNDNFIAEYNSIADAVNLTNIRHCCISSCCRNRQKTAGGYKWKFK